MVVPNCLHGRCDSAHLGHGKCIYHFTPLAQRAVGDLVLIIDYLWLNSAQRLYLKAGKLTLQSPVQHLQKEMPTSTS